MPKRNETLKFSTSFLGSARASAQTTIVDISYPSTYQTRWSTNANGTDTVSTVDEGSSIYFIINTDNVPNGTVLSLLVSGGGYGGISDSDITGYIYKQDVTINNNTANVKITIAADQLTEGTESFYGALLNLAGTVLSASYIDIKDTSVTPNPTYTPGWYSTTTGTTAISTINEGSTAWLIVKTTNVPDGTVLKCKPGTATNSGDFTDDVLDRTITIQNNVGRVSFPIKADNLTEGNETLTVGVYTNDATNTLLGSAAVTILDTSKETVITIPDEYHLKGVRLLPLFKKILGRDPYADEPIRVIVPAHIELNGFPRVIGRKFLRTEVTDIYLDGLGYAHRKVYEDTYWPAVHGISLEGMPNSELITIDVYGKIIGGTDDVYHADFNPKLADITFTPSGLGIDYYSRHSSGYYNGMLVGNTPSQWLLDWLGLDEPAIDNTNYPPEGYAIYSTSGFKLIVRNGGLVVGHGGATRTTLSIEQSFNMVTGTWVGVTGNSSYGGGKIAIKLKNNGTIKANVMSGGILSGGGGAGGNGGGCLISSMTHNDLSLSIYYGAYGPGGAPYGGSGYTFYGNSGDPICPTKFSRTAVNLTPNRRLGDTGGTGYRSKLSGGSASLTVGGAPSTNYSYGSVGQNYFWNFTAGAGGAIGQPGVAGTCTLYGDYRWAGNPSGKYTYSESERKAAGLPGSAGSISYNPITYDTSLT